MPRLSVVSVYSLAIICRPTQSERQQQTGIFFDNLLKILCQIGLHSTIRALKIEPYFRFRL